MNDSSPVAAPLDLARLQRTYTGLLDDVMIRYSADFAGERFFNKMIAKNIFFGGGIFINDGYLVNHPTARKYLMNEDSLLRNMLATGFVRILTRASTREDLARMPITMANQGNESFQRLVASPEWREFQPEFTRIAYAAFFNGTNRGWPSFDMSFSFTKLMQRPFATDDVRKVGFSIITDDLFKWIRDTFIAKKPETGGARDKLEKAGKEVLKDADVDFRGAMNELMTLGNQAYHYNFGLTLTKEEENGVAVDTTIGCAFDEFLEVRHVESGQLDDVPLLWLPDDISFDNGDVFRKFLDPTTAVGTAKLEYLSSLRQVISIAGTGDEDRKKQLREATTAYMNRIVELLAPSRPYSPIEPAFNKSFAMGIGRLDAVPGDNRPAAVAAGNAGLALSIYQTALAEDRQLLIERFKIKDVTEDFDRPDGQVIRFRDIRPQIASLAFDEQRAADFVSDIPPAPTF